MVAVGAHMFKNEEIDDSLRMLWNATKGGSSDAWYWLAKKCM